MAYRVPAGGTSSPGNVSSSPPLQSSSPPSSPLYARSSSMTSAAADPFSASAKTLSFVEQPSKRASGRSVTMPAPANTDRDIASLTLLPSAEPEAPNVLGQFFDASDNSRSSSEDELGSSYEAPNAIEAAAAAAPRRAHTRTFSRTESASADPISALGRTESFARAPQRRRFVGSSPKKLTRQGSMPRAAWERAQSMEETDEERAPTATAIAVQWDAVVRRIFDEGRVNPAVSLGGCHLRAIPALVGDLRHYVGIDPRRATQTSRSQLQFYLWDNQLTKLPSALFQLTNLGVLSLRKNRLRTLPASIGELRHLRELNVGGNELAYLPADIQRLQLETFTYVPNPFLAVPAGAQLDVRQPWGLAAAGDSLASRAPAAAATAATPRWSRSHTDAGVPRHPDVRHVIARVLGPLERRSFPSLHELCVQRLVSGSPMLLEQYETGCLDSLRFTLEARVVAQLEAARRSGAAAWGSQNATLPVPPERWYAGAHFREADAEASLVPRIDALDIDEALESTDDAGANVFFNRCPALHGVPCVPCAGDWPGGARLGEPYVRPTEERLEWVSHVAGVRVAKQGVELAGDAVRGMPAEHTGCLPLLWRGCSWGCLAFLETRFDR